MTFDEWWDEIGSRNITAESAARMAWEAGARTEREACAKLCDEQAAEPECPERATYCADGIRAS